LSRFVTAGFEKTKERRFLLKQRTEISGAVEEIIPSGKGKGRGPPPISLIMLKLMFVHKKTKIPKANITFI